MSNARVEWVKGKEPVGIYRSGQYVYTSYLNEKKAETKED